MKDWINYGKSFKERYQRAASFRRDMIAKDLKKQNNATAKEKEPGPRELIIEYMASHDGEIKDIKEIIDYMMKSKFARLGRDYFQGIINMIIEEAIMKFIIEKKFVFEKQEIIDYVKQKYPAFNENMIKVPVDEITKQMIDVKNFIIEHDDLKRKEMIKLLQGQRKEGKFRQISDEMFQKLYSHVKQEKEQEKD